MNKSIWVLREDFLSKEEEEEEEEATLINWSFPLVN